GTPPAPSKPVGDRIRRTGFTLTWSSAGKHGHIRKSMLSRKIKHDPYRKIGLRHSTLGIIQIFDHVLSGQPRRSPEERDSQHVLHVSRITQAPINLLLGEQHAASKSQSDQKP